MAIRENSVPLARPQGAKQDELPDGHSHREDSVPLARPKGAKQDVLPDSHWAQRVRRSHPTGL